MESANNDRDQGFPSAEVLRSQALIYSAGKSSKPMVAPEPARETTFKHESAPSIPAQWVRLIELVEANDPVTWVALSSGGLAVEVAVLAVDRRQTGDGVGVISLLLGKNQRLRITASTDNIRLRLDREEFVCTYLGDASADFGGLLPFAVVNFFITPGPLGG